MTEYERYPVEPDTRPMGPLEEGDQAIIDAIETIPRGHRNAYTDGEQIAGVSRWGRSGIREVLSMSTGDMFDPEDIVDRVRAYVTYRGISTEHAGVKVYGSHKVKYDSDRVSDGILITHPTRHVSSKKAQAHKLAAAQAIIDISQKIKAADEVVDLEQERKNRKTRPLVGGRQ